ncbi:MAG: hypothetical protein ACK5C5_06670 [Bacteroidota bacterium]
MKNSIPMLSLGRILVVIVCIPLLISGCGEKSTYYKLSEADMEWLHYDNEQILYFKSTSTEVTRFDVIIRVKSYNLEGNTYSEFTGADITQYQDTTIVFAGDNKGKLLISKVEESLSVSKSWPHFPIKDAQLNNLPQSQVNINGLNFGDIIILDGSALTDTRNYISKLWISKSLGVVQYEDTNGTIWTRVF